MDQEDFEQMASIGERPVTSGVPIFIPGAEDAGHDRTVSANLHYDKRSGRIFTKPNDNGTDVYELLHDTADHAPEHFHIPFYLGNGADPLPEVQPSSTPPDV